MVANIPRYRIGNEESSMVDAAVRIDSSGRGSRFAVIVAGQKALQGVCKRPSATRQMSRSIDGRPIRLLRLSMAPLLRPGLCLFLSYAQGHPANVLGLCHICHRYNSPSREHCEQEGVSREHFSFRFLHDWHAGNSSAAGDRFRCPGP
jgi:hypothetical protein